MRTEFHSVADVAGFLRPLVIKRAVTIGADFDGTLLDFASTPDGVEVSKQLREDMAILHDMLNGSFAGVTGRDLEFVDQRIHFPKNLLPCSAGHGAVFRGKANGTVERIDFGIDFDRLRTLAQDVSVGHGGLRIEEKPATDSIALHYELGHADNARHCAQIIVTKYNNGTVDDSRSPIGIGEGRRVFEIKSTQAGKDKGFENFIRLYPEKTPVFFGDTSLDAPAMRIAQKFGGYAIGVGPNPPESCKFYLKTPADTREVIAQLVR